jgi:uncharacterized protein YndB with AHSA1/START domain
VRDSVTLRLDAPIAKVWELVSDVTHIGRFSPETFEAEWLDDATGPAEGVRFRGHVRRNGRGPVYWTTCTIVRCDPGREFAFVVGKPDKKMMTWGYHLTPVADLPADSPPATDVTEFYESGDDLGMRMYWKLLGRGRRRTNAEGMRTTLERLKVAAET